MNRKLISLTTAFAIILISSVVALADSPDLSDSVGVFPIEEIDIVVPEEYKDPVYDKLASGDVRAATYDTTDIYNFIYYAMRGESATSDYSLQRIASYDHRIGQILYGSGTSYPSTSLWTLVNYLRTNSDTITPLVQNISTSSNRLSTIQGILDEIHFILNGDNYPALYVRPSIQDALFTTDHDANFITIADILYEYQPLIYAALNQVHSDGQNNSYYLSQINNSISSSNTSLSSIDSKLGDLGYISWYNYGTFSGASLGLDNNFISSASTNTIYYTFDPDYNDSLPAVFYFDLPSYIGSDDFSNISLNSKLTVYLTNPSFSYKVAINDLDYDIQLTDWRNVRVYIYNLPVRYTNYNFTLKLETAAVQNLNTSISTAFKFISSSSPHYYSILQAHFTDSQSSDLSAIRQVVASPDKVQAEQAQQGVESQVLDDFTGQGSESMSLSDVGGVKNVSSNAKQFLGTGSSGSNALSVFNVNGQGLWQWFSQTTADNLDSTTPTRGSDGYLTIYDQNMQNYLDGLGGDENAR